MTARRNLTVVDPWDDDGAWAVPDASWVPGDPHLPGGDEDAAPFEDLYDAAELAAIEAGPRSQVDLPADRLSHWRRHSALGAVLTGLALGYQEVFDPEEERSIVIEVDDEGEPRDLPVELFLDPDSASGSLCIVHRDAQPPPVV